MLSILDAYSDTLPATRTYARRSFTFIPVKQGAAPHGLLGNLLVKLQHSRSGVRRAVEIDGYSVEQDTPEPGDEGRAFWLHNYTDPDTEEAYRCVVGSRGAKCGCMAGKCRVVDEQGRLTCKHACAMRAVIEAGLI